MYKILCPFLAFSMVTACATSSDQASGGGTPAASSLSPEIRVLIAEVQSDYMKCMVPKLPEYDDRVGEAATVAASLREACRDEAENGAEKLSAADASPKVQRMLVDEWYLSLEGHSTQLVNQWRDHIDYLEPPNHRFREGSEAEH